MKAHGLISLDWQSHTLVYSTHGPFNIEGIEKAFVDIKKSVFNQGFHEWHYVGFLDENTLGSPEVMKVIGNFYRWAHENKATKSALYCSNSMQKNMLLEFLTLVDFHIEIFTAKQDALDYIETLVKES